MIFCDARRAERVEDRKEEIEMMKTTEEKEMEVKEEKKEKT